MGGVINGSGGGDGYSEGVAIESRWRGGFHPLRNISTSPYSSERQQKNEKGSMRGKGCITYVGGGATKRPLMWDTADLAPSIAQENHLALEGGSKKRAIAQS